MLKMVAVNTSESNLDALCKMFQQRSLFSYLVISRIDFNLPKDTSRRLPVHGQENIEVCICSSFDFCTKLSRFCQILMNDKI